MSHLDPAATKASRWVFPLFVVPCAAATFMTVQFILNVVPSKPGCAGYVWTRKFTDFLAPGRFAIDLTAFHNLTDGMPWIYPPVQNLRIVACLRRVLLSDLSDCY